MKVTVEVFKEIRLFKISNVQSNEKSGNTNLFFKFDFYSYIEFFRFKNTIIIISSQNIYEIIMIYIFIFPHCSETYLNRFEYTKIHDHFRQVPYVLVPILVLMLRDSNVEISLTWYGTGRQSRSYLNVRFLCS